MTGAPQHRTLHELLDRLVDPSALRPQAMRVINGVYDDSRRVQPGGLFVALRGTARDGRDYLDEALRRGAAVLIGENLPPSDHALVLQVQDARAALSHIAMRWYQVAPGQAHALPLAAVTGTNGKSTTAFMARAILTAAGMPAGMLGTVFHDLGRRTVVAKMTTPGPLELAALLRECSDAGAAAVVMEVSSHALDQKRTDGLRFAAAAFTNLTGDHLDYHGTFERYGAAKARLFSRLDEAALAVLNRDDPRHEIMQRSCRARVVGYAMDRPAEITARIARETIRGTTYRLSINGRAAIVDSPLLGRHNVYNAMAAAGLASALGAPPEAVGEGLNSLRAIPGRLQRVPSAGPAEVFVDYAHTDDALRNVLSVLRPLCRRRLIVVFGCGGDRDRTKRPRMARAVAEYAHAILVTSDNPRTEDPLAIIEDILSGFDESARQRVLVHPDRRAAIRAALAAADEGDVVLIAGKGHETYQIVGTTRHEFDDVAVAIEAAAEPALAGAPGA